MKKLLLAAYIFFCTGGTYAQMQTCVHANPANCKCWKPNERKDTIVAELDFNRAPAFRFVNSTSDTLRATLLITRNRMRMAYSYEGYAVINQRDTVYLDDKKRLIKAPVKVWGVEVNVKQ